MTDAYKILQYIKYCGGPSRITELIEYNNSHYIYDPRYREKDGYRYICPVNGNVLITSDFNDCHLSTPEEFVKNNPYIRIKNMDGNIAGKGIDEANYISSLMDRYIIIAHDHNYEPFSLADSGIRVYWEYEKINNEEDLTVNYYLKWTIYNNNIKKYE